MWIICLYIKISFGRQLVHIYLKKTEWWYRTVSDISFVRDDNLLPHKYKTGRCACIYYYVQCI